MRHDCSDDQVRPRHLCWSQYSILCRMPIGRILDRLFDWHRCSHWLEFYGSLHDREQHVCESICSKHRSCGDSYWYRYGCGNRWVACCVVDREWKDVPALMTSFAATAGACTSKQAFWGLDKLCLLVVSGGGVVLVLHMLYKEGFSHGALIAGAVFASIYSLYMNCNEYKQNVLIVNKNNEHMRPPRKRCVS